MVLDAWASRAREPTFRTDRFQAIGRPSAVRTNCRITPKQPIDARPYCALSTHRASANKNVIDFAPSWDSLLSNILESGITGMPADPSCGYAGHVAAFELWSRLEYGCDVPGVDDISCDSRCLSKRGLAFARRTTRQRHRAARFAGIAMTDLRRQRSICLHNNRNTAGGWNLSAQRS